MQDLRQSEAYAKYLESLGWVVEKRKGIYYFIRKFPLIGSVIKIQRPEKIIYNDIELLSKEHRAFQVVLEPKTQPHGFKLSNSPFLPTRTLQVDLRTSEKTILNQMHPKTRYNIKVSEKKKLQINLSKEVERFADFWQKAALTQRGQFISQRREINALYKAFGKNSHIVLATKRKEIIAGILMITTKDIAYYMYAASSGEGKKLFAPTLVIWEAIKLAKKLGCKAFDFEGIYDERFPIKSWKGFSHFKKGFGGREVTYPGSFVKTNLKNIIGFRN